jgi:hypothetical protein
MGDDMADRDQNQGQNGNEAESEMKIVDRRLFDLDGNLRSELEEEETEDEINTQPEPAPDEKTPEGATASEQTDQGFEHHSIEEPEGVDFTMLINAMAQPALIFLGEIAHPGSGEAQVNLPQAKIQIDMLELLKVKCRGNISPEEDGLLDRILYQLRMLYVSRSNQPSQ